MSEYGLIMSFDIDDGQLDGLSPQECFVLGFELAQIDAELKTGEPILKPIHSANKERIEKLLTKDGRRSRLIWAAADASEQWMTLDVPPQHKESSE